MATQLSDNFDAWIRGDFKQLNTELEAQYKARGNPSDISSLGIDHKRDLIAQGGEHVHALLNEGNTDEGFDQGFNLLGNVGFFMAACRRHEVEASAKLAGDDTLPQALKAASALSLQLGASLGVVPRFASAHLETHNLAINGTFKSFTSLDDEALFIDSTRVAFLRLSAPRTHCSQRGHSVFLTR